MGQWNYSKMAGNEIKFKKLNCLFLVTILKNPRKI